MLHVWAWRRPAILAQTSVSGFARASENKADAPGLEFPQAESALRWNTHDPINHACNPALRSSGHVEAQRRGPGLRNLRGCGSAFYAMVKSICFDLIRPAHMARMTVRPLAGFTAHIRIIRSMTTRLENSRYCLHSMRLGSRKTCSEVRGREGWSYFDGHERHLYSSTVTA